MTRTTNKKPKRRKVEFVLPPKAADEVILMGDFNKWSQKKHQMKKMEKG